MRHLLALVLVLGCGKSEDKADPGAPGGGNTARDALIETWKKAGLTASGMTAASVAFGKDCQAGTVNKVDVLICVYPSDAEAKAAEKPSLAWVTGTGASWSTGTVVVAVADRHKAEPSGKTINQLMKAK